MNQHEMEATVRESIERHVKAVKKINPMLIVSLAEMLRGRLDHGATIFACGNGGSAADAQHFVTELVCKFYEWRKPLRAVSLATDTSLLTAVANDMGYDQVFARQIEALARPGDVVICISTSGRSPNILAAMDKCRQMKIHCVLLTGDEAPERPDVIRISVHSSDTARIQEVHELILHSVCELLDKHYANKSQ